MAVHEYNELDHPAGFQGLRVVRQVNGKYKQKYFAFRRNGRYVSLQEEARLRAEAYELDAKWEEEQRKLKHKIRRDGPGNTNTGVRGISALWLLDRKFRSGRWKEYRYRVFQVSIMVDRKQYCKAFYVNKHGVEEAWRLACNYYRQKAGLRSYKHPCPDESVFGDNPLDI